MTPRRTAATKPQPIKQHPSPLKLIGVVALIVALDILLFFAIGYGVGKLIL